MWPGHDATVLPGPWLDGIRDRYGKDPQIKFFEKTCIADNVIGAVLLPGAAE
jgi:hypothetical protein